VVKAGADIVTFSGDKLLGGPQAGIIVGKKEVVERVKKNPLNRALRIDKFTLASLESVLRTYYDLDDALLNIPTLRMLTQEAIVIKKRAQKVLRKLQKAGIKNCKFSLQPTVSQTGGGAMPAYGLESWAIQVDPAEVSLNGFERDMRDRSLPLIGRIENDHFLIDCRTVLDKDIVELTTLLLEYFTN
jgi:L-seryl-tRNA(Ser) seleniumtransferase